MSKVEAKSGSLKAQFNLITFSTLKIKSTAKLKGVGCYLFSIVRLPNKNKMKELIKLFPPFGCQHTKIANIYLTLLRW